MGMHSLPEPQDASNEFDTPASALAPMQDPYRPTLDDMPSSGKPASSAVMFKGDEPTTTFVEDRDMSTTVDMPAPAEPMQEPVTTDIEAVEV